MSLSLSNSRTTLAALGFVLALSPATRAQSADTAAAEDRPTLESLEEKLGILERKLELAEEEAQKKKEEGSTATGNRDGFTLKSNDGDFQLRWRGYVQADARYFPDDENNRWANTFLVRRVSPIWEATAWKYYGFRIMADFAGSQFSLADAHVDVNLHPAAKFRIGKFKAPIGLERLQSATDNFLVELSYAAALTPNREVGAQLHGDWNEETVSYAVGVFNGSPDGGIRETDSTDHKEYIGRVFAQPFKTGSSEWLRNFGIGFAASWGVKKGDSTSSNLATIRSPAKRNIFGYSVSRTSDAGTVHAFGSHVRLNPEAWWSIGSFGLFGEYISSSQELRRGRAGAVEELTQQAWQVTASYFLTGEQPGFRAPRPRHGLVPAEPGKGGFAGLGAFELVGRVAQFKADEDAFPTYANPSSQVEEALSFGAGLNWHLSRSVRWYNNYEYTRFQGGAGTPTAVEDRDDEHVLFTRFQFSL
ncbi:MAG TPA: porin [Fibrobacteria bacterium]|nr:porin [Fibrobacteria bacterium]